MVGSRWDFALYSRQGAGANFAALPVGVMNICRKFLLIAGTGLLTLLIFIGAALADGLVVTGLFLSETPSGGRRIRMEQLAVVCPPRIWNGSNYDFVEFPVGDWSAKARGEAGTGRVVMRGGPDMTRIPEPVPTIRRGWQVLLMGIEAKS